MAKMPVGKTPIGVMSAASASAYRALVLPTEGTVAEFA